MDNVSLPGGKLLVNTDAEEHFPMRLKDWKRLRRKVEMLQKRRREFSSCAWAFVGIFASGIFAVIVWVPAYDTFGSDMKLDFAWVTPAFVITCISAAVIAVGAFWGAHLFADGESVTAKELLEDMDAIYSAE